MVWHISRTKVVLSYPKKAGIFGSHVHYYAQVEMAAMLKEATILNQAKPGQAAQSEYLPEYLKRL